MAESKDIIFTHKDLDGVVSYITLGWILNYKPKIYSTTPNTMLENLKGWLMNNKYEDYRKVFFLDLDTSILGDLIDKENVVIIDHHATNTFEYKNAKTLIKNYTSCAKLLQDTMGKDKPFTNAQKVLIALADDYDCAAKKTPVSYDLNIVFHGTNKKIESFIENYWEGFKPFDKFQQNMINLYKSSRDEYVNQDRAIFGGVMKIKDTEYKVVSTVSNDYVQEMADYLIDKYQADVVFIVITRSGKVTLRKKKGCELDLSKLAERLCDGGGHKDASGGSATTEAFQLFTKTLRLINVA